VTKFVSDQFWLSTAEHASNYFTGLRSDPARPVQTVLQPGTYRVIDGVLCRIIPGVPPDLAAARE
jgi:hypothetical protein